MTLHLIVTKKQYLLETIFGERDSLQILFLHFQIKYMCSSFTCVHQVKLFNIAVLKMTGETPEVRSDKRRKEREEREKREEREEREKK